MQVSARPRVTVLVTGAELKEAGTQLERGQIPESNSLLLKGLLTELGIPVTTVRRNADDRVALAYQLTELSATSDVIISTGGVGPGTHDVMRQVLANEPDVIATRVAIRPGQLQCTGRLRAGAFIFALPGNPVSAAVSFELFVRPALLAMQNAINTHRLQFPARASVAWPGAIGRLQVLPVVISEEDGELVCIPAVNPRGISHAVGGLGWANGYAFVGPEIAEVAMGDTVPVVMTAP